MQKKKKKKKKKISNSDCINPQTGLKFPCLNVAENMHKYQPLQSGKNKKNSTNNDMFARRLLKVKGATRDRFRSDEA